MTPVLFLKAIGGEGSRKNSGKLHLDQGKHRWIKNEADQSGDERPAGRPVDPEEVQGSQSGFGTHNIEVNDTLHFKMGDVEGSGRVTAKGLHGATVEDSTGREHQVDWAEVTGFDGEKKDKPDDGRAVLGPRDPVAPDKFNAAEWAKAHDDRDVTPQDILSHFPPDTRSKIAEAIARLADIEQTSAKYKSDGKYDAQRELLHHKIIADILSPEKVKAATPTAGTPPTFILLGGRGGSGKSWFEGQVYDPDKSIVLDPDHIKSMLPEYEGWNAAQVHEESADLFDAITDLAKRMNLNLVHDATMKIPDRAVALVGQMKDAGYRTEAHYMHLPRQEAAKRAVARFLGKTKRFVPPEVVLANTTNEASFDKVRKLVDSWSFRDNNVKPGEQPIMISQSAKKGAGEAPPKPMKEQMKKSLVTPIMALWRLKI